MIHLLKRRLINGYYFLKYKEAREAFRNNVPFDHFRDLNLKWIKDIGFRTIVDVGANKGQFAALARMIFPKSIIHSFEPLPECFEKLKGVLGSDPAFFTHNLALGGQASFLEFFRSDHSPSSSFLQMEDSHKKAFPESQKGHKDSLQVQVITLDHFFEKHSPTGPILLKVDVQGFEGEVLKGARFSLKQVAVVIMEMSLVPLYKDQPLFHDIYKIMYQEGFRYHGNLSQMLAAGSGEVVQIDAIFVNEMINK